LGYVHMFQDMLDSLDAGRQPMETFYDGYVVNAIMDACYRAAGSKKWEPVELELWRGKEKVDEIAGRVEYDADHYLIKEEVMPDGRTKLILKVKANGEVVQKIVG
jgi:hypothetical protein